MSVRIEDGIVHLEGTCLVEDAEPLLLALQEGGRSVDLGAATRLHLSVVQLLIAFRPPVYAEPADRFIAKYILPLFGEQSEKPREGGEDS